ncbi:mannose-6-phosphate isomerase [Aspergillus affinis]|uniref:mannose-6-phosphate isomerase n=1 Tax=Aspergillus affinis TaxID=1070780 RepID=UPI0022FEF5FC|nr:mannose-6-phosphate isomerase [Aspergillus affinis]KAI9042644.1 mannose-6-phosphate isomerase [Aspergillus affinis]
MVDSVVQLKCECKHDPWGKQGKDSIAGQLWSKTPGTESLKDDETYSEMWMGTYPTVPSRLLSTGELLSDYLKKNPQLVGKATLEKSGAEIPFLPKILSFAKSLPLQIHPDKSLAEKLHAQDPHKFGDSNHKPEIAIALSHFELFAGFKPFDQIATIMHLPPLTRYLPSQSNPTAQAEGGGTEINASTLRQICKTFLSLQPNIVAQTISELQALPDAQFGAQNRMIPSLLTRLKDQYTEYDNGALVAALLMNYMAIGPGEAVCVPADGIHAWLSGDIVECMARSDNVLNTGFCPRPDRDNVELFAQALSFHPRGAEEVSLPRKRSEKGVLARTDVYAPPFSEFNVLATELGKWESERHEAIGGPSLVVVTKGEGKMEAGQGHSWEVKEGAVFFVGQGVELKFVAESSLSPQLALSRGRLEQSAMDDAFHHNHVRSDDYESTDSSSSSSNTSRDRIIIGVVVGGVAAMAITAGILFVLFKKRKWDRIRRYEERVLAAHTTEGTSGHGYKAYGFALGDLELGDTRASSSLSWTYGGAPQSPEQEESGQHQSQSQHQRQGQGHRERRESHDSSPPPAYQPLPVYDPSRYSGIGISRLPAAVKPSWMMGSRGSMAMSGSGSDRDQHRHSTTYIGGLDQSLDQRARSSLSRSSPEGSRSFESEERETLTGQGGRGPRRPKPVLSRLITNL